MAVMLGSRAIAELISDQIMEAGQHDCMAAFGCPSALAKACVPCSLLLSWGPTVELRGAMGPPFRKAGREQVVGTRVGPALPIGGHCPEKIVILGV